MNQRPFRPYALVPLNTVTDIVPSQNNYAADYEWCYPCNQSHNQVTCSNGVINQALMVQNSSTTQPVPEGDLDQQQDAAPINATFMNWLGEDFCAMGGDDPTPAIHIRTKKRALVIMW